MCTRSCSYPSAAKNVFLTYVMMMIVTLASNFFSASASQQTYRPTNDNRCILKNVTALQTFPSVTSERFCATKCLLNNNCTFFLMDVTNKSCLLYSFMSYLMYLKSSYLAPMSCKIWYSKWGSFALYASSGQFVVPPAVTSLRMLAVGGGAGGTNGDRAGGGSGYVSFAIVSVVPGQSFTVSIGNGGSLNTNGGTTTFGSSLFVAMGGNPSSNYIGGSGGSGGGGGRAWVAGQLSGSGGSGGSNGQSTEYTGGSGQGSNFTAYFSQFRYNVISAGSGGPGAPSDGSRHVGGGGGGGVLVNGTGPSSNSGECCPGSTVCGPGPATGYGAGGNGACWSSVPYDSAGSNGVSGLVYIEFD